MKTIIKKLKALDWFMLVVSIWLIVFQVWLDLKIPDYMSEITTLLQTGGTTNEILANGGMMLLLALISLGASFIVGYFVAKIGAKIGQGLRGELYNKVESFSKNEIKKFSIASLVTRCSNDTTQIQQLVAMGLQIIVKAPILAVWAICKIVGKSWQWSLLTAGAIILLLAVIITIIMLCLPKFKVVQKQIDDINRVTRENLTGMRVIHAFNAEEYQNEKFEEVNTNLTKTQIFTSRAMAFLSPFMSFLIGILSVAIYWIGAYIINNANMLDKIGLFSDMIVFSSYAMQVISAFVMIVMIFMILPRAIVSIKRVNEVLNTKLSIIDGKGVNPTEKGTIEFKNVDFQYADAKEKVLTDLNFKINKGETVAIIGSTGCGKTTLIDLIPRFYDATFGKVLVDGENVKDYKLNELYEKIGYVSQTATLLSGKIVDNLTMGNEIDEENVKSALEASQSNEFVNKMENKENSIVYQGGKNLSGGQKQRISIARAIAKKPEIIIFDDSFSALDYKTDKKIRKTLNKELKDTTKIIVAQRIGTIKDADKILVLKDGRIVGMGKHDELLKNCKVYCEIALSQLSKEEL